MREDEARVQLKAAADAAARRGSLLFHLDLATALGIEALNRAGFPTGMLATVVDREGYGVWSLDEGTVLHRRACVRFAGDGRPVVSAASGAAPRSEAALAQARRTVDNAWLAGEPRVAIIVIPQADASRANDPIEAYALALPDHAGDMVLGMHWRAAVSGDGMTMLSREPLSHTALVLPARGPDAPPYAIETTHFGAVPSEIHSWASLKHGIAISVATLESGLIWTIDGEHVVLDSTIAG